MPSYMVNDPYLIGLKNKGEKYRRYRELWASAGKKIKTGRVPLHIDMDTIDACNCHCIMCHDKGRKRTGRTIDLAVVKRIIEEGVDKGLSSLNIGTMGEPYLAGEVLFEIASYASEKGVLDIFVHTNFLLVDEQVILETIESGVTAFCISVDAVSPETYRAIRGADFNKVLENVKLLSKIKRAKHSDSPVVRISAVPCYENKHELNDFFGFWEPWADIIEIQGYRSEESHKTKGNICSDVSHDCVSPWKRLMIWPHGDVTVCCSKRGLGADILLGNIYAQNESLEYYWNCDRIEKIRKALEAGEHRKYPSCDACLKTSYTYEMPN